MSPDADPKVRENVFAQLARFEQAIEDLRLLIDNLNDWSRSRSCAAHAERLERIETLLAGRQPRPPSSEQPRTPTGMQHKAIKDLESRLDTTERTVLAELQGAEAAAIEAAREEARRAIEERDAAEQRARDAEAKIRSDLEAAQEKAVARGRERVRWTLEVAKYVIALLVGSGIVGMVKCELPKAAPALQHAVSGDASVHATGRR